jgi:CheY-like chemotaxis protein
MAHLIVVIDDERDVLDLLCDVLRMEGLTALGSDDPVRALSLSERQEATLFLIDVMLPGMSGIEVARKLREDGHATTPMIAMSASSSMVEAARRTGFFQETLAKPFDLDDLMHTVHRYVA